MKEITKTRKNMLYSLQKLSKIKQETIEKEKKSAKDLLSLAEG